MRVRRYVLPGMLLLLGAPALAQTPQAVLLEGDVVPGVGTVIRIDDLAVNDEGVWLVEAVFATDRAILRDGAVLLRRHDPLPLPAGATVGAFGTLDLGPAGEGAFSLFLGGGLPADRDSGVYRDTDLQLQEGDVSGAPEFLPGTRYLGFSDVEIAASGELLVVATVELPDAPGQVARALVRLTPTISGPLSETVVVRTGDVPAGQTAPVSDVRREPHQSAVNAAGQVLYQVELGGASSDEAIYLDGDLIAQEGQPSPVAGRAYEILGGQGLDLNDDGVFVFKADLEGDPADDALIVVGGAVLVRSGGTLPAIGGFRLQSFGDGPVKIAGNGSVLWYGDWNDPDTAVDAGLFLDDRLLVQEGMTTVDGFPVEIVHHGADAFDLSENGRFVLFEADLASPQGRVNGVFRIDLRETGAPPVALCGDVTVPADSSCTAAASIDAGSFDPDGGSVALSQDPPGPYPLGSTGVTLEATDSWGETASCDATVTVLDETAPTIDVEPAPGALWPPNHRMVDVGAMVTATDDCGSVEVVFDSATSDEPDDGPDDGDTVDDIQVGTDPFELRLRAERARGGDGRLYTVTYRATDTSGNGAFGAGTVGVAHDQDGVVEPILLFLTEMAEGTGIAWTAAPAEPHYNVIRGSLGEIEETPVAIDLGTVTCIEAHSVDTDTAGREDSELPAPGEAFYYLVEYVAAASSGFGTESAPKPRIAGPGACE